MAKEFDRKIVLEDGSEYYGYSFGAKQDKVLEAVFNTSCVGYQEIVSDPSYTDQLVVMTYPVIGNYGVCDEDYETKVPTLGALAVRDYNDQPSNFRCTNTLSGVMEEYGISGIYGIDTRKLAPLYFVRCGHAEGGSASPYRVYARLQRRGQKGFHAPQMVFQNGAPEV